MSRPRAIFLMGPTAAGKTGMAVELCERFPLDIISVDSALVYRGMDIGTAKPDSATLRRAPHRLLDIRDASQAYSAADFCKDARREMQAITAAGRIPLLVGGTMLYFRALEHGLSELPSADPGLRKELARRAAGSGWPALHAELAKKDPVAAARIKPTDPQRIQRALEVIAISGRPMSEMQQATDGVTLDYDLCKIVLSVEPRSVLHQRIAQRFDAMLQAGFIDEMKSLFGRSDLKADMPSMRAVGYRQAWEWLDGRCSYEEMREKALAATRQLAKRQLTWLRREGDSLWYNLQTDGVREEVVGVIGHFLEA